MSKEVDEVVQLRSDLAWAIRYVHQPQFFNHQAGEKRRWLERYNRLKAQFIKPEEDSA